MSDSFFGKLKNKVNYKLNEAVEDPDAQKYAKDQTKEEQKITPPDPVKTDTDIIRAFVEENKEAITNDLIPKIVEYIDRFSKRPNQSPSSVSVERNRINGILMEEIVRSQSIDELYWKIEDEIELSENKTPGEFNPRNIPKQMWRNTKRYFPVVFFPILSIFLASLVANDMIIYPAPVRFVFFMFTMIATMIFRPILVVVGLYYTGKRAYDYYVNEMSEGPKRLIMPTLFALLPLTTHEHPNWLLNGLMRPFKYGEKYSKYDAKELDQRMENYQTELNEAFPYVEVIKTKEPYQARLQKIQSTFETLHKAMGPTGPTGPTNNLPAVIKPIIPPRMTQNESRPLPPVIQPVLPNESPPLPLPPVIQPVLQPPVLESEPPVEAEPPLPPVLEAEPPVLEAEPPLPSVIKPTLPPPPAPQDNSSVPQSLPPPPPFLQDELKEVDDIGPK